MRFRKLALGATALAVLSALLIVQAQDKPPAFDYTANTTGTARAQGEVNASGIRWKCAANRCTASGPWPAPGIGACRALAQLVGPITYYGHPKRQLSAAELAKCNVCISDAAGTSAPAMAPSARQPSLASSGVSGAQLRQTVQLRTENYAALRRVRDKAAEEVQRQQSEMRRRNYADSAHGSDCDDLHRDVNPNAAEVCDGRDNNCDGVIDEGQTLRRYLDADGDGHGDPARGLDVCPYDISAAARAAESSGGGWMVEIGNDCNDADPAIWRDCH
jgi:hypothetical protein